MIEFSNGHKLDFACASGALAYDGRGWPWEAPLRHLGVLDPSEFTIVAKTVTGAPRKGNLRWFSPWRCVQFLPHGAINSVGLTNPGIHEWATKHYPVAKKHKYKIAASVMATTEGEAHLMSGILNDLELAYVEVNISCPNVEKKEGFEQVIDTFVAECKHPLVLKLAYGEEKENHPYLYFANKYDDVPQIEAYHLINTVPWKRMFKKESPLSKYGLVGGISGDLIKGYTFRAIWNVRAEGVKKPVIAGGGLSTVGDFDLFLSNGLAQAISIGTAFLKEPWAVTKRVRDFRTLAYV